MIRTIKWFEEGGFLVAIFYFNNNEFFNCLDPNNILGLVCGDLSKVFLDGNKLILKYNNGEFQFDVNEKNILTNPQQTTYINTIDFNVTV